MDRELIEEYLTARENRDNPLVIAFDEKVTEEFDKHKKEVNKDDK